MSSSSLDPLSNKAIDAALRNNWQEAIEINVGLLERYPDDIDTLNRLARAYFESGKASRAREIYRNILKLDPYNPIASKNIEKISDIKNSDIKTNGHTPQPVISVVDLFLEDPGQTEILKVINSRTNKNTAQISIADQLELRSSYSKTEAFFNSKKVGILEELWGEKIAKAIRSGCRFEAHVVSIDTKQKDPISLFVRVKELSKDYEQKTFFPIDRMDDFKPYVSEEAMSLITSDIPNSSDEDGHDGNNKSDSEHASLESMAEKEQSQIDSMDDESTSS